MPPASAVAAPIVVMNPHLRSLAERDWDFRDANTSYLTHGLHPYPAKFIPQIPHAVISELSAPGDTVADIFCGSGTSMVEALLQGRNAIGLDANPLACLISAAKAVRLTANDVDALAILTADLDSLIPQIEGSPRGLFDGGAFTMPDADIPTDDAIAFWFEPHVARELGVIRALIQRLCAGAELLAKACLSSIIVAVSKQDSDTRYVRRDKQIAAGETIRRFLRALRDGAARSIEFSARVDPGLSCRVIHGDVLRAVDIGQVDLVVTSPPYPNAYSYHLYHMTRMLWLGMDQKTFKKREIGSHRKYSLKSAKGATRQTFLEEIGVIFGWLHQHLKSRGYACFVIGDSIIRGDLVRNDEVIIEAAEANDFSVCVNVTRNLQDTRKAFNPKIGKIKQEHVVILQRTR